MAFMGDVLEILYAFERLNIQLVYFTIHID